MTKLLLLEQVVIYNIQPLDDLECGFFVRSSTQLGLFHRVHISLYVIIMDATSSSPFHRPSAADDVGSSSESNSSETESVSEEERVRRLFLVCDADGDGFIDRYYLKIIFIR